MTKVRRKTFDAQAPLCLMSAMLWIGVAGCSASSPAALQRALLGREPIDHAIVAQSEVDAKAETSAPAGSSWFEVRKGTIPIILTVPHATRPGRADGSHPFADGGGTAALGLLLHESTGATVIYTTYASPSDPNFYDDNAFKSELANLIAEIHPVLILDLHGSHSNRAYDVDIGTMNGASLLGGKHLEDSLVSTLRTAGLVNFSSNYFSASKSATITKFAANRHVPAMQLEISSTWLVPADSPLMAHRFAQLAEGLTRFILATTGNGDSRQRATSDGVGD